MTDSISTCVENAERRFSQRVQWTPLLPTISIFACENTHSVALSLHFWCDSLKTTSLISIAVAVILATE